MPTRLLELVALRDRSSHAVHSVIIGGTVNINSTGMNCGGNETSR
jgi:hypothetical protein